MSEAPEHSEVAPAQGARRAAGRESGAAWPTRGAAGPLRVVVVLAAILIPALAPSLAHAVDLCGLLPLRTLPAVSQALEDQGCKLKRDYGTDRRAFDCAGGVWLQIDASNADAWTIVTKLEALPGYTPAAGLVCPGYKRSELEPYDNPFVLTVAEFSRPGEQTARIALLGEPGDPNIVAACLGYHCYGRFDDDLTTYLGAMFGSGELRFLESDMRVAGLDPTRVRRGELIKALTARGGRVVKSDDSGALVASDVLEGVEGVPGLRRVTLTSIGERLALAVYNIPAEADYVAFSRALDDRYGASTRVAVDGCFSRMWLSGGARVVGRFCKSEPDASGFSFANDGAVDIATAYLQKRAEWAKDSDKPTTDAPPKPKSDMF